MDGSLFPVRKPKYVKNGKGIKNDCIIVTKENMV